MDFEVFNCIFWSTDYFHIFTIKSYFTKIEHKENYAPIVGNEGTYKV